MKKILFTLALALVAALSLAVKPGKTASESEANHIVTKTVELVPFDRIVAKGKFDIKFVQGEQSVKICGHESLVKNIRTDVSGKVLTIDAGKSTFLSTDDLVVFVVAPVLKSVRIEGAGDFEAEQGLEAENLELSISGAGDIEIKNLQAGKVGITINGAGDISVERADCESIDVTVNGAGDVDLEEIECGRFSADINGAGSAEVSGHAGSADIELNGAGSIDIKKLSCDNLNSKINGIGKINR